MYCYEQVIVDKEISISPKTITGILLKCYPYQYYSCGRKLNSNKSILSKS